MSFKVLAISAKMVTDCFSFKKRVIFLDITFVRDCWAVLFELIGVLCPEMWLSDVLTGHAQ